MKDWALAECVCTAKPKTSSFPFASRKRLPGRDFAVQCWMCEGSDAGQGLHLPLRASDQGSGLRVEGRGSKVKGRGSRVKGQGSRVEGRGSRVKGQGSRVEGQGSRVKGQGSRVEVCAFRFLPLFSSLPQPPKSMGSIRRSRGVGSWERHDARRRDASGGAWAKPLCAHIMKMVAQAAL
eukprot:3099395-Rhodomonas_salina.3